LRRVSLVGIAQRGGLGASCRKRCFTFSGILASLRLSALMVTHVLQDDGSQEERQQAGNEVSSSSSKGRA
jgi:hypothetical protein